MIVIAKNYLINLLQEIGLANVGTKNDWRQVVTSQMKPRAYALIEKPDPEEYTRNVGRIYEDSDTERIYHSKEYDCSVIFQVIIGGMSEEEVAGYKRQFIGRLARNLTDPSGYRIDIVPLAAGLAPEDSELGDEPVVAIRIRFMGGVWKSKAVKLIKEIGLEGKIIKNKNEMEGLEGGS